jgi:protein-tyrosine phosphatase
MDAAQARAVEAVFPGARGRVHRIGAVRGFDVPDPYGQGRTAFERALSLIELGVDDLEPVFTRGRPRGLSCS